MALIICPECGKEISSKASSCPHCGCPMEKCIVPPDTGEEHDSAADSVKSLLSSATSSIVSGVKDNLEKSKSIKKVGIISINEQEHTFQIKGAIAANGKKTGLFGGLVKGTLALSTMGMSLAAEKALGLGKTKVGSNDLSLIHI